MAYMLAMQSGTLVVDRKQAEVDRFDDLTLNAGGTLTRRQFKFSVNPRALELNDLATDQRGLRLDKLLQSVIELSASGDGEFRICSPWLRPSDSRLGSILIPSEDAGSFFGVQSQTYRLDVEGLWDQSGVLLVNELGSFPKAQIIESLSKVIFELECPNGSLTFDKPGELETLVIDVLAQQVGLGQYPNVHLTARDAAIILVNRAREARNVGESVEISAIESYLRMRKDYGRVSQEFPLDASVLVPRKAMTGKLLGAIERSNIVTLVGEPGSGKSWILHKLGLDLRKTGRTVARHYCYLEPGDPEVTRRVTTEVMFGNLIAEIVDQVPALREEGKNPYSAGLRELERLLPMAVEASANKELFLIIDGLDHIARVQGESRTLALDDVDIIESLAAMSLTQGVHLVLGSQPGAHLQPLFAKGGSEICMDRWSKKEIRSLCDRTGVLDLVVKYGFDNEQFFVALDSTASGNPLYATYICRALKGVFEDGTAIDPIQWIGSLPGFSVGLTQYYDHLLASSPVDVGFVANTLAVAQFGLTEKDLAEIHTSVAYLIPTEIKRLQPVLKSASGQGGLRIYHESFRRHLLERIEKSPIDSRHVYEPMTNWMEKLDFFQDSRAYRFYLPLLRQAGSYNAVLSKVDYKFVSDSVAMFHPEQAIVANIDVAASVAAGRQDFAQLSKLSHLRAAVWTCFEQKMDVQVYGQTYLGWAGPDALAERLIFDGRPTVGLGIGLQLCSLLDDGGGRAPWEEYLKSTPNSDKNEKDALLLARCHGFIRTKGLRAMILRIAEWWNDNPDDEGPFIQSLVARIRTMGGSNALLRLRKLIKGPGRHRATIQTELILALIQEGDEIRLKRAVAHVWRLQPTLDQAARLDEVGVPVPKAYITAINLDTQSISNSHAVHEKQPIQDWIDSVQLLARYSPEAIREENVAISGDGRYYEWLSFIIDSSLAFVEPDEFSSAMLAFEALRKLNTDTSVFAGSPRACDLYSIHDLYVASIGKSLQHLRNSTYFDEACEIAYQISTGTLSNLDNHSSGPLTPDALARLLLSFVGTPELAGPVKKILLELTEDAARNANFYDTQAEQVLLCAQGLWLMDDKEEAKGLWDRAAQFLTAYGFRKDLVLDELIEATSAFDHVDNEFARKALQKVQPLAMIAMWHTDGKETKHLFNYWFRALISADPAAASSLLASGLRKDAGFHQWTLERAVRGVAKDCILGSAEIRSYIMATHPFEDDSSQIEDYASILRNCVSTSPGSTQLIFDQFFIQCQGESEKFSRKTYEELADIAKDLELAIPPYDPVLEKKMDSEDNDSIFERTPDEYESPEPIDENASPLEVMTWVQACSSKNLYKTNLTNEFSDILGPSLVRLANVGFELDCGRIVRHLARTYYFGGGATLLSLLGETFEKAEQRGLASLSFALAYIHTRGRFGWGVLGGPDHHDWFESALRNDPDVAWGALSTEVSEFIHNGTVYGMGQHLTQLLIATGRTDEARDSWNQIYTILNWRLPVHGRFENSGLLPPYDPSSGNQTTLDEALTDLLVARISHPDLSRKQAAIAGLVKVVRHTPEEAVVAYEKALSIDSTLCSISLILRILQLYESAPYPITVSIAELLKVYVSLDHFSIRWSAVALLERIGVSAMQAVAPLAVSTVIGTSQSKEAVLALDTSKRIRQLEQVDEGIGDRIVAYVDQAFACHHDSYIKRGGTRYKMARNRIQRNYPDTPILKWETEVFEEAINHETIDIPSQLIREGTWSNDSADQISGLLLPDLIVLPKWWGSRTLRPDVPLTVDLDDVILSKADKDGWLRLAYYERQLLLEGQYRSDVHSECQLFAGVVASAPGGVEWEIPLGRAESTAWYVGEPPRFGSAFKGPVVGLAIDQSFVGTQWIFTLPSALAMRLSLFPEDSDRLCLVDGENKPAVLFRRWSVGPLGDDIQEQSPRLLGCDLIARPDVFDDIVYLFDNPKLRTYTTSEEVLYHLHRSPKP